MTTDILILGGGITGLSAAYALHQRQRDFVLLEAADQIGGALRSRQVGPFQLDHGANSFAVKSDLRSWLTEIGVGEELLEAQAASNKRFLYRNDQIHALAPSPLSLLGTRLLSLSGKLRLLREPLIKAAPGPQAESESVEAFFTRRLGAEAYAYLIEPVLTGIYAGNAAEMRAASVLKQAVKWEQEHGSLLRGAIAQQKSTKAAGTPGRQIISFKGGLQALAHQLAAHFSDRIHTGHQVISLKQEGNDWHVSTRFQGQPHTFTASKILWTLPAHQADLLQSARPDWVAPLKAIPYPPMHILHLGYNRSQIGHSLDGFGFLVPRLGKLALLGAIWNSSIFADKAPQDQALFTLFIGGAHHMHRTQEEVHPLTQQAQAQFEKLMHIKGMPSLYESYFWKRAIPQYTLATQPIRETIMAHQVGEDGLALTGNWLEGVAVGDCIRAGKGLAELV